MQKRARRLPWLEVAGMVVAAGILTWTFRDARLERVVSLLSQVSAVGVLAILLPQLASQALETAGWSAALRRAGERVGFGALLRVRVATEALQQSLPGGALLAEPFKAPLLMRHCGLDLESAIAAILVRKYLLVISQSAYILLAAGFGLGTLEAASPALLGSSGLGWLMAVSGVAVGATAWIARLLLSHGRLAIRLWALLARLPGAFAAHLSAVESRFATTDRRLKGLFQAPFAAELPAVLWVLGGWMLEAVETYLILRLLGVELGFFGVAGLEAALSLARSLVFVVPAGLGVLDAGYVAFLSALGVPDAVHVGGAFSLLKRSKELVWSGVGFGLLSLDLGTLGRTSATGVDRVV